MNASSMETFLARLYTDAALRRDFLVSPAAVARRAGLDEVAVQALERIDRQGLQLAADSYALKKTAYERKRRSAGPVQRLLKLLTPKRLS
jgi:hypothetical protein